MEYNKTIHLSGFPSLLMKLQRQYKNDIANLLVPKCKKQVFRNYFIEAKFKEEN